MRRMNRRACWVLYCSVLTTGCAALQKPPTEAEVIQKLDASAAVVERLLAESREDEAVKMVRDLAAAAPERAEPWGRLAKLYFDRGDYGNAIVAADEVIRRVPGDRHAMSLRAVGGLRVATAALIALQGDAEMSGSARADAGHLAKVLRETLGEDVLVPPADPVATRGRVGSGPSPRKGTAPTGPARRIAPRTANQEPVVSGDPFSILR